MTTTRLRVKGGIERLLCRSGVARLARAARRERSLILAYHNIVPDGQPAGGEMSLHLPQRSFADQLDLLLETHDIVPLEALFSPQRDSRPRAVITFDDAYAGAVTAGADELLRRGLPATFFVAPAFVGGATFWWDVLAGAHGRGLAPAIRAVGLDALEGDDPAIRAWAARGGLEPSILPAHQRCATEAELSRVAREPGIVLASHTWSHRNLPRLEAGELLTELTRPLEWLRERFENVLPWLAYPYGRSSPPVEAAAERAGYAGAVLVEGGYLHTSALAACFSIPRINVPAGISIAGFELRAAGVLGD